MIDEKWMDVAIAEAKMAEEQGDVPVGAVVVVGDRIVGRGHNSTESLQDPTAHAEVIALSAASATLGTWRLTDATLYVTLEPCPMCAGAIILARVKRVVFGAKEPKFGAGGSVVNLFEKGLFNHCPEVQGGVREDEIRLMMQEFFRKRRK